MMSAERGKIKHSVLAGTMLQPCLTGLGPVKGRLKNLFQVQEQGAITATNVKQQGFTATGYLLQLVNRFNTTTIHRHDDITLAQAITPGRTTDPWAR